ncbi:MAG: hypothetical protein Q9171_001778 [Xanthocarpia ochracea]
MRLVSRQIRLTDQDHGQRVELGEVEAAVLTQDKRIAATTAFNPTVNQTQIIAFFECEVVSAQISEETSPWSNEACRMAWGHWRSAGRQKLLSFMVPSAFIPIPHLTLTAKGKIDRAELQKIFLIDYLPHLDRGHCRTQLHEQESVTESKVRDAVAALFGAISISIDTALFREGILNSLSSTGLAAHLRIIFIRPIRLRWIIESRTSRDLAYRIDTASADEHARRGDHLPEQSLQIPPTMSFSQSCNGRKVFCIHPSSGLSYPFQKLAQFVPEVSMFGINDPCFRDPEAYQDIGDLADLYRQHTVQLVLIDPSVEAAALEKFKAPEIVASVLRSVGSSIGQQYQPRTAETKEFQQKFRQEIRRNLRILPAFRIKFYPGRATLLRASNEKDEVYLKDGDITNGHGTFVEDLRVERLAGDHSQIFLKGFKT